jgi:hypothetical protein
MRTIWLAVIAVVFGAGSALHADDSMMKNLLVRPSKGGMEVWAVQYTPSTPAQPLPAPKPVEPLVVPPAGQPAMPAAPVAEPVAPAPCATCGQHGGHHCWEKLRAWLCYRPLGGCCHGHAVCCRPAPLYLYTFNECVGCGQKYTLPPCAHEAGAIRGFLNGDHPFANLGLHHDNGDAH